MNTMHIIEYDEITAKIDIVREQANFIPDVSSKEGYDKSKRVALDVGKLITRLDAVRKDKKAFYLEGGRQVDAQAKLIKEKLEEIQQPHKLAYKELDDLKKKAEQDRKDGLESRVQQIRTLPEAMADASSEEIKLALNDLEANECLDFYEYAADALNARNKSKKELADLFAKKLQEEKDAEELAKLRKQAEEQERIAREQAIREDAKRQEIERQEAEKIKQAEELAKREADKIHIGKVRGEAKEDLMALGLDEEMAKKVVLSISNNSIRNIKIIY